MSVRGFDTGGLGLATPTQSIIDAAYGQVSQGRNQSDFDSLRRRFYEILDGFELASVQSTSAIPGAFDSLTYLKSKGVRLAVLTNSGRKAAASALSNAGLEGFFEFVLTRDDTDSMKPRPDGLKKGASLLGLPPGSIFYVGDSPLDVLAAKSAGLRVISVATGNYSEEWLKSEGADFVVPSLRGLAAILGV